MADTEVLPDESAKRPREVDGDDAAAANGDGGQAAKKQRPVCEDGNPVIATEGATEGHRQKDTAEQNGQAAKLDADKGQGPAKEEKHEKGGDHSANAVEQDSAPAPANQEDEKEADAADEVVAPAQEGDEKTGDGAVAEKKEAKLGPRLFTSSKDMFNYFYELLRAWPLNFNLNKYEQMMLEDLLNQGYQEPEKKVGAGISAFQVRINPDFYSRCFYVIRKDGSMDHFSYRKCVDHILPLPEELRAPSGDIDSRHKGQGGRKDNGNGGRSGGGRRGGRGRGGNRGRRGHRF